MPDDAAAGRQHQRPGVAPAARCDGSRSSPPSSPWRSSPPAPAASAARAGAHTIHVDQPHPVEIWPAASPGSISGKTGWTLRPGAVISFKVPDHWNARLWGRTGCHFGCAAEAVAATGDCDGCYQCTGWGEIPATLGEFNFDAYQGLDFYDISMVHGSNLPMYTRSPSGGETKRKVDPDGCQRGSLHSPVHCPGALRVCVGPSSPASPPAPALAPTATAAAARSPGPPARRRRPGRSTTRRCSSAPSPTPIHGRAMTRPASSPARAAATTGSSSESPRPRSPTRPGSRRSASSDSGSGRSRSRLGEIRPVFLATPSLRLRPQAKIRGVSVRPLRVLAPLILACALFFAPHHPSSFFFSGGDPSSAVRWRRGRRG